MKAVNRHSLIGFALGLLTAGSLNLVISRDDRQPDGEQSRSPVVRGDASRGDPYEVPEVLGLPVAEGSRAYLEWLAASCGPGSSQTDNQSDEQAI